MFNAAYRADHYKAPAEDFSYGLQVVTAWQAPAAEVHGSRL